jgi:hypothetical protein
MENRKQSLAAVALVGEGPVVVTAREDDFLLVDCPPRDDNPWEFLTAYRALPIVIESAGVRYTRVSYRWQEGGEHTAYYHATSNN